MNDFMKMTKQFNAVFDGSKHKELKKVIDTACNDIENTHGVIYGLNEYVYAFVQQFIEIGGETKMVSDALNILVENIINIIKIEDKTGGRLSVFFNEGYWQIVLSYYIPSINKIFRDLTFIEFVFCANNPEKRLDKYIKDVIQRKNDYLSSFKKK